MMVANKAMPWMLYYSDNDADFVFEANAAQGVNRHRGLSIVEPRCDDGLRACDPSTDHPFVRAQLPTGHDMLRQVARLKPAVVCVGGHGSGGDSITMPTGSALFAKVDTPTSSPQLHGGDLSSVWVVGFFGCETAMQGHVYGALLTEATSEASNRSAHGALGFTASLPGSGQQGAAYETALWAGALGRTASGDKVPTKAVFEAALDAQAAAAAVPGATDEDKAAWRSWRLRVRGASTLDALGWMVPPAG